MGPGSTGVTTQYFQYKIIFLQIRIQVILFEPKMRIMVLCIILGITRMAYVQIVQQSPSFPITYFSI